MSEGQSVFSCLAVWVSGKPWSAHNKFENNVKSKWGEQTGSWESLICAQQRFHEECGVLPPQPFQTPEQRVWVTMWNQNEEEETGRREVMNKWDKMLKYVSAALSCGHCYSHKSLPFNFNWAFLCHCLFVDQVMRPSKGSKIPLTSDFWVILRLFLIMYFTFAYGF